MSGMRLFVVALLAAALAPLYPWSEPAPAVAAVMFPGWPAPFRRPGFVELELGAAEQGFVRRFPGKIAKFSDGRRTFIVRWITRATRRLHPAADCFRAAGFAITQRARCPEGSGAGGCFDAERGERRLAVHERIEDARGGRWGDVSAWYWAAQWGQTQGPWWSVTTVQALGDG